MKSYDWVILLWNALITTFSIFIFEKSFQNFYHKFTKVYFLLDVRMKFILVEIGIISDSEWQFDDLVLAQNWLKGFLFLWESNFFLIGFNFFNEHQNIGFVRDDSFHFFNFLTLISQLNFKALIKFICICE